MSTLVHSADFWRCVKRPKSVEARLCRRACSAAQLLLVFTFGPAIAVVSITAWLESA